MCICLTIHELVCFGFDDWYNIKGKNEGNTGNTVNSFDLELKWCNNILNVSSFPCKPFSSIIMYFPWSTGPSSSDEVVSNCRALWQRSPEHCKLKKNVAKKKPQNLLYFQVIQNPAQSPTPYSAVTVQSCGLVTKKEKNKTNIAWSRHVEKAFINQG